MAFRLTRKLARIIIVIIWLAAACIMTPWAVYYQQNEYVYPSDQGHHTIPVCGQNWPSKDHERGYFLGVIFLTCYTLPLILISGCYSFIGYKVWNRDAPGVSTTNHVIYKSKVKALKMLIVVVILFAFSWLPLYAINIRIYFGPELVPTTREFTILTSVVIPVAQWLGLSNSCVNPLIYCLFSKKFRRGFQELIHCWKGGMARNSYFNRNNSATYRYTYHSERKANTMRTTLENSSNLLWKWNIFNISQYFTIYWIFYKKETTAILKVMYYTWSNYLLQYIWMFS